MMLIICMLMTGLLSLVNKKYRWEN
uniref:Uncharacterized protein n=1 Tax=Anguilla anguilla TaxID=7936 RepID=A0A0E9QNL9_ANGAN